MENFQVISQLRKTETKSLYLLELRKMNISKPKSWSIHVSAVAATKLRQSWSTVWPHRRQPTRLLCPWDSPGKTTGVCYCFHLQCMKVKSESEVTQSCLTLCDSMDCSLPGPLSMGFSRQEYWSGQPCPPPYTHLLNSFRHIWHKNKNGFDFSSQFHCKDDKNKHSGLQFSLLYWVTGIWENDNGY